MLISWGNAATTWRSSRQTVSALSTAEAELNAAATTWQVTEGLRVLLEEWGVHIRCVRLLLDNEAALSIARNGSNWRTRYFGVRGARIQEEFLRGRIALGHQPTKTMVADGLTKLAASEVLETLRRAMGGEFPPVSVSPLPTVAVAHRTSVTPGPQQQGDPAGDGPAPVPRSFIPVIPALPPGDARWKGFITRIYAKFVPDKIALLPDLFDRYTGREYEWYAALQQKYGLVTECAVDVRSSGPSASSSSAWSQPEPTDGGARQGPPVQESDRPWKNMKAEQCLSPRPAREGGAPTVPKQCLRQRPARQEDQQSVPKQCLRQRPARQEDPKSVPKQCLRQRPARESDTRAVPKQSPHQQPVRTVNLRPHEIVKQEKRSDNNDDDDENIEKPKKKTRRGGGKRRHQSERAHH